MRQINFYALADDIINILDEVENIISIKYTMAGQFYVKVPENFESCFEIPSLGKATSNSTLSCESFLVTRKNKIINIRDVRLDSGELRYCMDQLLNPDSVSFTPAGKWNEDVIIAGRISTASNSEESKFILKKFDLVIRKKFSKTKAFWIGAGARELFNAGKRLTFSVDAPRSLDLS